MICPNDGSKDFDDLTCRDCKWYMQCFKMWQDGNIFGKDFGDNFPTMKNIINKTFIPELKEIEQIKKENQPKISQEDIEDLKIDLELYGRKNAS